MKYDFIQHKECEYFPCHSEEQNCLFCYCPLFFNDKGCQKVGSPIYLPLKEDKTVKVKDCSNCEFPHKRENFPKMMAVLREEIYGDYVSKYGGGLNEEHFDCNRDGE